MGTTTRGYPYPEGTDPINQGDDAIKALAGKVDLQLRKTMAGFLPVTVTAGYGYSFLLWSPGWWTQIPIITLSCDNSLVYASNSQGSLDNCTIICQPIDPSGAVNGSVGVHWVASDPGLFGVVEDAEARLAALEAEVAAAGGIDAWLAAQAGP